MIQLREHIPGHHFTSTICNKGNFNHFGFFFKYGNYSLKENISCVEAFFKQNS